MRDSPWPVNAVAPAAPGLPPDPRLTAALSGRYHIERELGRGGMATVYLARDLRHARSVAVKVMHPELALGRERFLREIGVAAGLAHPHIVALHDSGDADGLLYYVMPYVAGQTLRDRLTHGPACSIEEVRRLAWQVADALGAAHERGIVHRDVKPENILITPSGHALVTDFGVAMAMHASGGARLTVTGASVGTPAYMSPEQLYAADIDARSDVWAVGCIIFEMLTGRLMSRGAAEDSDAGQRMAAELRRLRSDTPDDLVDIVRRCVAADAGARFASGRELAAAIGMHQALAPAARGSRKHQVTAAIGVAVLVMVLGAWLATRMRSDRQSPRDPQVLALYQRAMREFERRTPEGAAEAARVFQAAIDRDSTFAPAWVGLANVYTRSLARQWNYHGDVRDSLLRLAITASRQALMLDSMDARAWAALAEVSRHVDPTDMGVPLRAARKAVDLDSGSAFAWFMLGISLADSGDLRRGFEAWREGARRNPTYNQGLAFVSLGHLWLGRFDSAAVWADSSVSVDPAYFLARHTLGLVEIERGNYVRAMSVMESARRLTTGPDVVVALSGRAVAEARSGDALRARATLRLADSLGRRFEPAPLHVAVYLATVHAALGDTEAAVAALERYPLRLDRHFQLHVQCEPAFAPIARDPRFIAISQSTTRISGC